ncbi:MAG: hypothetical protein KC503_02140 [Myxococcales bacterium]|nr:hypothetical protein [Myxococcales bacterium]
MKRLTVIVVILVLSPLVAHANTSPPSASSCIRTTTGSGHTATSFWSTFRNACGTTQTATFDVLLYWCADQTPPGGQCFFDHDLKVDTEVTLTFAPYQTRRIEQPIPGTVQCGFYQWDINFKPNGCTNHGDCWTRAKGLPATSGEIFGQSVNCQTWVCQPGQRHGCSSGCGEVICASNGQWDSSQCSGKNRCGQCGPEPACCANETKACASGCGTTTCGAAGAWDASQCQQRDACGQCPGPGSKPCCPGAPPKCADCEQAECTDKGWVCAQTPPPACGGACQQAACVDGKWACRNKTPISCGPCKHESCDGKDWTCVNNPAPADDVLCGPPPQDAPPPKGTQPPQQLDPDKDDSTPPPPPPTMAIDGGCDCSATGAGPPQATLIAVQLLLLLGLALRSRRQR